MLTPPNDAVETDNGFKILRGKYWVYYNKSVCTNCSNPLFECKQNIIRNKGRSFCCKACQSVYRHKIVDPLGASILDKVDTPEFVYLIGLAATDGHITYPPNYVHYSCDIGLKDYELITKLKERFGGRIRPDNIYHWRLNNIDFVEYLKDIGFTHNKSYTLNVENWFNSLTPQLQGHFIRGVIDGDGSIFKNKHNCWGISVVSASLSFIRMIYNYANVGNYTYDGISCYYFRITNKLDINAFLDRIYDNTALHLERKYIKYQQFKSEYASNKRKLYKIGRKGTAADKGT